MRANPIGVAGMKVLRAIAAGRVHRDDVDGTRLGMWALVNGRLRILLVADGSRPYRRRPTHA
jgi:hypothetical protein